MEARAAVALAKYQVRDIFAEDGISDLTLEEVDYDNASGHWLITVGFLRPKQAETGIRNESLATLQSLISRGDRELKVVRIDVGSERVLSIKNRELEPAS